MQHLVSSNNGCNSRVSIAGEGGRSRGGENEVGFGSQRLSANLSISEQFNSYFSRQHADFRQHVCFFFPKRNYCCFF